MAYDVEFHRAKELYEGGKSPDDISTMIGVPRATVYRWVKDNGWKQNKIGRALNLYDALNKMMELVGKKIEELATTEGIDERGLKSVGQILSTLERLEKKYNKREVILTGLNEYTEWLRMAHQEDLTHWSERLPEFAAHIRTKYPEK